MQEPEERKWHQNPIVRILLLLMLPLIVGGLYFITTRIALKRPTSAPPLTPESPIPNR